MGIFGDQDQAIPVESVKQFASALNASEVTNKVYLYEGVGHAFANPPATAMLHKRLPMRGKRRWHFWDATSKTCVLLKYKKMQ